MHDFIEITNNIINEKLVKTNMIHLIGIHYGSIHQILDVTVTFCTTDNFRKQIFKYSYCLAGSCGFNDESKRLLARDFSIFIERNFPSHE
jgi:hypothetical protein